MYNLIISVFFTKFDQFLCLIDALEARANCVALCFPFNRKDKRAINTVKTVSCFIQVCCFQSQSQSQLYCTILPHVPYIHTEN